MAENLERAINRLTARVDQALKLLEQQNKLLKKAVEPAAAKAKPTSEAGQS